MFTSPDRSATPLLLPAGRSHAQAATKITCELKQQQQQQQDGGGGGVRPSPRLPLHPDPATGRETEPPRLVPLRSLGVEAAGSGWKCWAVPELQPKTESRIAPTAQVHGNARRVPASSSPSLESDEGGREGRRKGRWALGAPNSGRLKRHFGVPRLRVKLH